MLVSVVSCNSIRQSSLAKKNIIKTEFYNHYFNGSLKLSIRFFGGHRPVNPPLGNYKKHTPKVLKTYLRKELRHSSKYKMLFYSYSPGKVFGFYYIGLLHNHFQNDTCYKKEKSINNSIFFERNETEKIDNFLLKKYIIPLGKKDIIFYCFKKILFNYHTDSATLKNDTYAELMTLKTLSNFKPFDESTKYFSDSVNIAANLPGYATPLNALLKLQNENRDKADINLLNQYLFSEYAALDEIDTIRQLLYEQHTFKGNSIQNRSSDTLRVNNQFALPEILKEAERQKVMMINESHYDWRHRYFVTLLLDSLYKKGYKYLCMEALINPNEINNRKFPATDDGFYIKEPFMANLARTALKIGYKLIAYEDSTTNLEENLFHSPVDKREYYQALNLYNQYEKDTTSKWLVYAGYSHINKYRFGPQEESTMAKYFHEFSKVNPYSINQTQYCDIFSNKVAVDSSGKGKNYYYLRKDQINDSVLLKQSDLYIINNIHTIPYAARGVRKYHIHYDNTKGEDSEYFIEIFLKEEYFQNHHAIPIYIKRVSRVIFDKNVWLPENNYYLIVTDENDKIIYQSDF